MARAASLLVLLLSIAACGGETASSASTPTSPPTPTAIATAPTVRVHPEQISLPVNNAQGNVALAVSPLDGHIAWSCAPADGGGFRVWLSTDTAATWRSAGTLRPTTPGQPGECAVVADQGNVRAAVFRVDWGTGEGGDLGSISFYTADGGAHWTQLTGWVNVSAVETDGSTVYALVTVITLPAPQQQSASLTRGSPSTLCAPCSGPANQERPAFVASHDGLRSWRELQPEGPTTNDLVQHFWGASSGVELYATTVNDLLLRSSDGGVTWVVSPVQAIQAQIARRPAPGGGWTFCGLGGDSLVYRCSADTGATWHVIPTLQTVINCAVCPDKGGDPMKTIACPPSAILDDGSLIAFCPPNHGEFEPAANLAYQLAPGASAWAELAGLPAETCLIAANGILWCSENQGLSWETLTLVAQP